MKEGFRLLNKSIIRVETPDINFDEEEDIINGGYVVGVLCAPASV